MRTIRPWEKISLGRSNGRPSLSRQARWAERPATLAIILMSRLSGIYGMLQAGPRRTRTVLPVRVDKCAEHGQQLGSESLLPNLMGVKG